MILYYDGSGTIIKNEPEPVYQGSDNANTVYFVAPFAPTCEVSANFTLPNGEKRGPVLMTSAGAIEGTKTEENAEDFSVWLYALPKILTAYAGDLTVQFSVYNAGQKINTQAALIPVIKGVAPVLPAVPKEDIYDDILKTIAQINAEIDNINGEIPTRYITDVTVDDETNIMTIAYSDGTSSTIQLPDCTGEEVVKDDWLRVISFNEESWLTAEDGGYALAFGSLQTQFKDTNYIVQLTQSGKETYRPESGESPTETAGYYTLADAVFKGSDGSLLITSKTPYEGKLYLLGGSVSGGMSKFVDLSSRQTITGAKTFANGDGILVKPNTSSIYYFHILFAGEEYSLRVFDKNGSRFLPLPLESGRLTTDEKLNTFAKSLELNENNFQIALKDAAGNILSVIDLPLETMVVSGSYDEQSKKIILLLKNGQTIEIPVASLVEGLVDTTSEQTITGKKKFSAPIVLLSSSAYTEYTERYIHFNDETGNHQLGFPAKTGTFALVSDVDKVSFKEKTVNYAAFISAGVNTKTIIGTLTGNISIGLGSRAEGIDNEWDFVITQGETAYTVLLPPNISWVLGAAPTFDANTTTYVILYYVGETLCGEWRTV